MKQARRFAAFPSVCYPINKRDNNGIFFNSNIREEVVIRHARENIINVEWVLSLVI